MQGMLVEKDPLKKILQTITCFSLNQTDYVFVYMILFLHSGWCSHSKGPFDYKVKVNVKFRFSAPSAGIAEIENT